MELGAKLRAAERVAGTGNRVDQAAIEIVVAAVIDAGVGRGDREVDLRLVAGHELHAKRIWRGGGTMLDREQERVLLAAEVEVRVAPVMWSGSLC